LPSSRVNRMSSIVATNALLPTAPLLGAREGMALHELPPALAKHHHAFEPAE